MARLMNRLSARTVATMRRPGRHADGGGLYLHVDPLGKAGEPGSKRWVYVFQWEKKRKEMGLGPARLVGLAEARELALSAAKQVAAGQNPVLARRDNTEGAPTFGDVANDVIAAVEATNRNPTELRTPICPSDDEKGRC